MRGILVLLDLIEFISQPCLVLGFNHLVHVIRSIGLLTKSMPFWDVQLVIDHARMDLFQSGLVLKTLPIFSYVLRGPGAVPSGLLEVDI